MRVSLQTCFASIAVQAIKNQFLVIRTSTEHFYGMMSLVSPQNKLKIEVCTICFKKIRDACFSPPKFGSTENVFFHPPQKRDDSQLTFSTRTYSWQKLNKTVVIFQWIFFVLKGQHHQLLQPVESSSQVDGLTWKMIFHFLSWFFVTLNCTNMFGATVKCHQWKEIMPCGNVSSFLLPVPPVIGL